MFVNQVHRFQSPTYALQKNSPNPNFAPVKLEKNLQNDRFDLQPKTNKASASGVSFGMKLSIHAQERMLERAVDMDSIINTVKNGRKFLGIEETKFGTTRKNIINLNYHKEGKVPEGTSVVVTNTTGNTIVTTYKAYANQCEIRNGKLMRVSTHTGEIKIAESWLSKFSDSIFQVVKFKSAEALSGNPKAATKRVISLKEHQPRVLEGAAKEQKLPTLEFSYLPIQTKF